MLNQDNRPCQVQGHEGEFVFRCYAQEYEEFQNGAAPVPVAIVENVQSGQVLLVYAGHVMFTTTVAEQRKLATPLDEIRRAYFGDPT